MPIAHDMAEPHVSNQVEGRIYIGTALVPIHRVEWAYVILAYVHPQQRACMACWQLSGCLVLLRAYAPTALWHPGPCGIVPRTRYRSRGNFRYLMIVPRLSRCSRTYARAREGGGEAWDVIVQRNRVGEESRGSLAPYRGNDAIDLCSLRCDAKTAL